MIKVKNILCPVDFFPASEGAATYAAEIALAHDARLKLLHVISPIVSTYKFPMNPADVVKTVKRTSEAKMKTLRETLQGAGVMVTTEIRVGNPQSEIKHAIEADKPDLVVMGTHGRRGIERWFLGSVTESLLRHSPVPLLTVSPASQNGDRRVRRIAVTTDFSDGTADALAYAFSIAAENQARVDLLHVVDDVGLDISKRYGDPFLENVKKKLESLIPGEAKDWCDVDTTIEAGIPYRVILKFLQRIKPDLLVMNIHGKNMLDRALLGTTADRVIRAATCPVMLIPPMNKTASKRGRKKRAA
jgi:nucleotide-binding universal stress UspA family protein